MIVKHENRIRSLEEYVKDHKAEGCKIKDSDSKIESSCPVQETVTPSTDLAPDEV